MELRAGAEITVESPRSWHRLTVNVTSCSDPVERFAVAEGPPFGVKHEIGANGALVLLLEDHINPASAFGARPKRFLLNATPSTFEGCCDTPNSPGYEFFFRDHGRDFEAFVFIGTSMPKSAVNKAVAIKTNNVIRVLPVGAAPGHVPSSGVRVEGAILA
jgi:hypothetical protein